MKPKLTQSNNLCIFRAQVIFIFKKRSAFTLYILIPIVIQSCYLKSHETMMSIMSIISHMWSFKSLFQLILNCQCFSHTSHMSKAHKWLVTTTLDRVEKEQKFEHIRKVIRDARCKMGTKYKEYRVFYCKIGEQLLDMLEPYTMHVD